MSESVLYDVAGPRTRRRIRIGSVIGGLFVLALIGLALRRLAENGQFAAEKWAPFVQRPALYSFLWQGLLHTLQAAAIGLVLALLVGVTFAIGRLTSRRWIRTPSVAFVEFFRGVPVLLLMFFFYLGLPLAFGIDLSPLLAVVLALTIYNGVVIAEIIRASVLSLPAGQTEAAYSIGLRRSQALRFIQLPQAFRLMLPALISQLVVLVKDTSLGFIVGFQELLSATTDAAQLLRNPLQLYTFTAVIYILINSALSWFAGYVDRRQRRKYGARGARSQAAEEAELG